MGQMLGPAVGGLLTFNVNIFGRQINPGNSPAVVIVIIWCFLLTLTIFLPNDLIVVFEPNEDFCIEDDIGASNPVVENKIISCPKRIVFSMYYYVFILIFLYCTVAFYVPLLAVHQLGLKLAHVKLLFIDGLMFCFVAYITIYLLVERISQKNLLGFRRVSLVVPIIILSYFALFRNKNIPVATCRLPFARLDGYFELKLSKFFISWLIDYKVNTNKQCVVLSKHYLQYTACCYDSQSCKSRHHIFQNAVTV